MKQQHGSSFIFGIVAIFAIATFSLMAIVPDKLAFLFTVILIVSVPVVLYTIFFMIWRYDENRRYKTSMFIMNRVSPKDRDQFTTYDWDGFAIWKDGYSQEWYEETLLYYQ